MREFVAAPCTTELYELGECCRWDEVREELSWVDVLSGRFFRAKGDGARSTSSLSTKFQAFSPHSRRTKIAATDG